MTEQVKLDPIAQELIKAALYVRNETRDHHGFLSAEGLKQLAKVARFYPVKIKTKYGSLITPATFAAHYISMINASGIDSVTDVLTVGDDTPGDMERAARYIAENPDSAAKAYRTHTAPLYTKDGRADRYNLDLAPFDKAEERERRIRAELERLR